MPLAELVIYSLTSAASHSVATPFEPEYEIVGHRAYVRIASVLLALMEFHIYSRMHQRDIGQISKRTKTALSPTTSFIVPVTHAGYFGEELSLSIT